MSHMNPLSVIRLFMLILSNILWWVPITTIWYSFSRTLGSSVTLMLYSSFTSFASVGNTMMDMCCGDEVKGEGWWRVFFAFYKHILRIQPVFTYFKRLFLVPKWVPFFRGPLFPLFLLLKSLKNRVGRESRLMLC